MATPESIGAEIAALTHALSSASAESVRRLETALDEIEHDDDDGFARPADGAHVSAAEARGRMEYYKEYFSKLRLSYIQQVTKENFLRSLTSADPSFPSSADNAATEASLVEQKGALKAQKDEVAQMLAALDVRTRQLVSRSDSVDRAGALVQQLATEIPLLDDQVRRLRAQQSPSPGIEPAIARLGPDGIAAAVRDRAAEADELDEQIAHKEADLRRLTHALATARTEAAEAEGSRADAESKLAELRRKNEEEQRAGWGKEVSAQGRWYSAAEGVLRQIWDGDDQ